IFCRYYKSSTTTSGAIWVGGVGGGFDSPAGGLYPQLSRKLKEEGISSLRIQYRYSTNLAECIYDIVAGIKFLQNEGISSIALIGHSLGGAVVIQAALMSNLVHTVVTLATQSYGADNVKDLPEETSILLIHGQDDSVLPVSCSRAIFGMAHEPKERILLSANGHCLEESADEVKKIVYNWILNKLKK
ncbi:MAG: alpha/beta hydrolase, partial [Methanobacterium sp.]